MHGLTKQSPFRGRRSSWRWRFCCRPAAVAQSSDAPRTPWGDPDLGGVWDYWTFTPLERPEEFADRATLTAEEAAVVAQEANAAALARDLAAPPGDPGGYSQAVWTDRARATALTQTALIVDPPDGRIPPLTPEAEAREEARLAGGRAAGPDTGRRLRHGRSRGARARRALSARVQHRAAAVAGRLQQQRADLPDAGRGGAVDRDEPRRARGAAGRPPGPARRHPTVDGQLARPLGGRHPGHRYAQLHGPERQFRPDRPWRWARRASCTWRSGSPGWTATRCATSSPSTTRPASRARSAAGCR